ncbi:Putative F-box-like domain superfamily protein [Septoria linicola]|uniref:F-box-like domain superfamily protein n=1 Tax=Septoria linicola TaxID=215465 RepID=A0A9Q9ECR5_9PEZI|nr:Putative F-box-like domain superfamily protein [Septoria linicola]
MDAANGHDWRHGSEAPSDSSDFYSTEAAPPAIPGPVDATTTESAPETDAPMPDVPERDGARDEVDSSSDMDLSEPSQPTSPTSATANALPAIADADAIAIVAEQAIPSTGMSHAGAKRKLSDAEGDTDGASTDATDEQTKKRRVDSAQTPRLPTDIWQRVFMLLPPAVLCRCLRVCKDFNHMLTATMAPQGQQKDKSTARIVDSEAIWTQSRKIFFPQLPRPLRQHTELEMLKLVGGQNCQFCGKAPVAPPATSVFNCGPGTDGVRVIFPFGVRTCGPCIEPLLLKDVQLLAEPISARLRLGISHAFRNEEYHFVTDTVRQMPPGITSNLKFSKVYYQPHLAAIKQEENEAQQLGQGAADEWRKGLYNKGKDAMADSARWEKWEAQLRLGVNLAQVLREYDPSSFPHRVPDVQSRSAAVSTAQLPLTANGPHPLPLPVHVFPNGYPPPFPQFQQLARPPLPPQHHLPFPPPGLHHQLPYPPQFASQLPYPPQFPPQLPPQLLSHPQHQRPVRNPQEVESARQARRAEIEKRCRELEPPVEPNVLQHMESFQAAMQIATPLTAAAWEMLKPRILAQREAAELAEHARASQLAALQAAMPSYFSEDVISKPAKEVYDREYEDAQTPLRKRLGEYADDIINGHWGGGKMLDRENVPIFAIKVLEHVHRRYVEDKELGNPPPAPFLSLDNMKWVYDNKVRPFTDVHRKEHFICAGCDEEKKPKWFAFEGLIQHYGAKHTTTFSKGNIIVHWQTAEWPETPPFHINPAQWLRPDRRVSDYKREQRARNTSQNHHGSSFQKPCGGSVHTGADAAGQLSSNPYQGHGQVASQGPTNGHLHDAGQIGVAAMQAGHEAQYLRLASDSRETWDALDGVPDMLECVRVQTALYHAVSKFVERYHQKPTLDLLTDALATQNSMRPVKNVTGLACKSCVAAGDNSYSNSYWTRIRGAKFFNTSSLVTHFKLIHQSHGRNFSADWIQDMIELPEGDLVKQLLCAPGMDDAKLAIVAVAFPTVFTTPLPKIGHITEDSQRQSASEAPVASLFGRLSKKQKGNSKKKGAKAGNGAQKRDNSNEPLPEAKEDEYDPLRPALVSTQSYDPAQFDTDARKPSVPEAAVAPPPLGFELNPDMIAMLQTFSQASHGPQASTAARASRSPSVGGAESAMAVREPTSVHTSTSKGPPDIGAILAGLMGKTPTATPPTSASNKPVDMPHQSIVDGHGEDGHKALPPAGIGSYAAAARPNRTQRALSYASTGNEIHGPQATQPQTHTLFEQSQQKQYPNHTYSAAPQPQYQAAPQYQYLYEQGHSYGQAAPHAPDYREHAPPQYVQIPERGYAPHNYQYDHVAPKPIYVDQYGRPLIPVDAAPAPIQYAPNAYEQQQQYSVHHGRPVYASVTEQPHLQPVYDDRRPVYYEQPTNAVPLQYPYDDRASVGRT